MLGKGYKKFTFHLKFKWLLYFSKKLKRKVGKGHKKSYCFERSQKAYSSYKILQQKGKMVARGCRKSQKVARGNKKSIKKSQKVQKVTKGHKNCKRPQKVAKSYKKLQKV